MDLPLKAADGVDLGDARRGAQLRPDHPVLQGAQVRGRVRGAVGLASVGLGLHGVHENLAQPGGDGAHFRVQPFGQLGRDLLQALSDLLAGKVQVGAVLEHDSDLGEPITRQRAAVVQLGQAGHGRFNGKGHPLLGLQRRVARGLGVDLDLDVGDVRRGVDGKVTVAPHAQRNQRSGEHQRQPAMADGQPNEAFEHGGPHSSSTVDFSMSALIRKL